MMDATAWTAKLLDAYEEHTPYGYDDGGVYCGSSDCPEWQPWSLDHLIEVASQ